MPVNEKNVRIEGVIHPTVLTAIRACALIAFGISAYLAWISLNSGKVIGCGPESGCDRVLHSKWAYWFGVPVSVFAVLTYAVIVAASLRLGKKVPTREQRDAWALLLPCGLLVMAAAPWFVVLQVLVVKSFCPYCMAAHAAGLVTGLLLLVGAPFGQMPDKPWQIEKRVFVPPRIVRRAAFIALAGMVLLVVGQIAYRPPTSREVRQEALLAKAPPITPSVSNKALAPLVQTNSEPLLPKAEPQLEPKTAKATSPDSGPAPLARRLFPVYGGRFSLAVNDVPSIGSPTNEHVAVSLFDYTCHHCRLMHPLLLEMQRAFSNQLVILSLPMPLDPQCNQTVTRTHPDHTNACDYARLGLSLWRADRAKHHEFEEWLFAGERPPPLSETRERARQLVGAAALDEAAADPWVESQLKLDIAIYELAFRSGHGSMPQLLVGATVAEGTYPQPELMKLFSEKLGLNHSP